MKLREKALSTGKEQGCLYDQSGWQDFILHLQKPRLQDPLTRIKSEALNIYWNKLGVIATALAHGGGILDYAARLGNKFGG